MIVTEVNVTTGATVERTMTPAEVKQLERDQAEAAGREKASTDDRAGRDRAESDWRGAVERATTVEEIKAALLGTNLSAQADVRAKP